MAEGTRQRGRRRLAVGVVTRDKMDKTRRVEIQSLVKHKRYGKYVRRRTVCYVHDEKNESQAGDTVEIQESRPLSKTKHWRLVRIVTKAPGGTKGIATELPETVTAPAEATAETATETPEKTEESSATTQSDSSEPSE